MRQKVVLTHVNFWDGEQECLDASIEIVDGRIEKISPSYYETDQRAYNIEETRFLDMRDLHVVPGWIDSHLHLPGDLLFQMHGVVLVGAEDLDSYFDCFKAWKIKTRKNGTDGSFEGKEKWLRGFGWNALVMDREESAYKRLWDFLNQEFAEIPVLLFSDDYHNCIGNRKAFALVKEKGIPIEPDEFGVVCEKDIFLLTRDLEEMCFSEDEMETAILAYQEKLLSYGITTVQSLMFLGGNGWKEWKVLLELEKKGELNLKVNLALTVQPWEDLGTTDSRFERLKKIEQESALYGGRIKVNTIKVYMDGVIENQTAYLKMPYEGKTSCGDGFWRDEVLKKFFREEDAKGRQIHIHAIGDEGVHQAVEALTFAMDQNQSRGQNRHVITHLQLASDEDIYKMGNYGILASIQPYWFPQSEHGYGLEESLLGKRAREEYKAKTLREAGVMITGSSDSPVTPEPNPLLAISMAENRYDKKERLAAKTMIDAFSKNGAYQIWREKEVGQIRKGRRADLIGYREDITRERSGIEKPVFVMTDGRIWKCSKKY